MKTQNFEAAFQQSLSVHLPAQLGRANLYLICEAHDALTALQLTCRAALDGKLAQHPCHKATLERLNGKNLSLAQLAQVFALWRKWTYGSKDFPTELSVDQFLWAARKF